MPVYIPNLRQNLQVPDIFIIILVVIALVVGIISINSSRKSRNIPTQSDRPSEETVRWITNIQNEIIDKKLNTTIEDLNERINGNLKVMQERMDGIQKQVESDTKDIASKYTTKRLQEDSVSRKEFETLKEKVDRLPGDDEIVEQMNYLREFFGNTNDPKVYYWKCEIFKLMKSGALVLETLNRPDLPKSSIKSFLNYLKNHEAVSVSRTDAYHLNPEFVWLYGYIDRPDMLQKMLSDTVVQEKQYQEYLKCNLELIEPGMGAWIEQYKIEDSPIDIMCIDKNGKSVGIELKYPKAVKKDWKQITAYGKKYVDDYMDHDARFLVVAPKITDDLKTVLQNDGIEYVEVPYKSDEPPTPHGTLPKGF